MFANRFSELMRQPVIVYAGRVEYRGTLVEVTMEDVKLRGPTGWIIVPLDRVQRIVKEGEETLGKLDPLRESSAELFMDDQALEALQAQQAAEKLAAAQSAVAAAPPVAEDEEPEIEIFDPTELTSDIDFNPVPLAPFDEETPTEFRDLPGIPASEGTPVTSPHSGVADEIPSTFRPPSKPPKNNSD